MELLLDTANLHEIERLMDIYPIDGITTNPSIMSSCGDLKRVLSELRRLSVDLGSLHVQTTEETAEGMVAQGERLADFFGPNLYLKLPVSSEGIKAMRLAKAAGLNITATAVFTPLQGLIAAKAGASYIAPYVNRLDDICGDGVSVACEIYSTLKLHGFETKVLGASFKNIGQILALAAYGIHAVTVNPDLMDKIIYHPSTDVGIKLFNKDWQASFSGSHITDYIADENDPLLKP